MITPSEIVRQIKTYLPLFTDRFTELLPVTSATVDASNIVTVLSPAHGKTPGQSVIVSGGTTRNPLSTSALSADELRVTFTTKYDHDLIRPSQPLDDLTLTLAGFGNVWDDVFDIIDVPNRRNFTVLLPDGETVAPPVDESQYLIDTRTGLAGVQVIATVPSVGVFTIDLAGVPPLPPGQVDGLSIISGFRVSAAADFKRAQAVYAKQDSGNDYLFVIMTDGDISKDRHTLNDGVAGMNSQDMNLIRMLRNFSTVVFIPTGDDLSGANAQDAAYNEIYAALLSTLFGYEQSDQVIKYGAVPSGDGPAEYNTAYYAHTYDWQIPGSITYQDGFLQQPDVAFRDIAQTLRMFNDAEAEMIVNINLDEEPL